MKKIWLIVLAALMLVTFSVPASVDAQTAAKATWTSAIAYYNPTNINPVDQNTNNLNVTYYNTDGTSQASLGAVVNKRQAGELLVGSNTPAGFKGSAVISSGVPLVAVYRQFVAPGEKDRNFSPVLYTAFNNDKSSYKFYIPTFTKSITYLSQVGIQNLDSTPTYLRLDFYAVGAKTVTKRVDLPTPIAAQASYILSALDTNLGLPRTFNGSLIIRAYKNTAYADGDKDARIAAAAQEREQNGRRAYAFEGIPWPADDVATTDVYSASALCKYGRTAQTTYFAVQNLSDELVNIYVQYYDATGKPTTGTATRFAPLLAAKAIRPYTKASISTCSTSTMSGKSGSARFFAMPYNVKPSTTSEPHGTRPIAVTGKVQSNDGLMTGFIGETQGAYKLALPYAPWGPATGDERAYISVVNVGNEPITDMVATYYYYDDGGTLQTATHVLASPTAPLAPHAKASTNPSFAPAGMMGAGGFTGAVEITTAADGPVAQPIISVVRVQRSLVGVRGYATVGEDYNGIPTE